MDVICLGSRKKRDIEQRMKMLSKLSNGGIAFQSASQLHCISCSDTTNTKHNGEEKRNGIINALHNLNYYSPEIGFQLSMVDTGFVFKVFAIQ